MKIKTVNKHIVYCIYFEYIYILVAIIFDRHRDRVMQFYLLKQFFESMKTPLYFAHVSVFLYAGVNHR